MNNPAISDEQTMLNFPDARRLERDTLIDLVNIQPGISIVDVQSAGGFLSDEIYKRLRGDVTCICVEPSPLRLRLSKDYRVLDDPVETLASIRTGSVDITLGLAGLHHSSSHLQTVQNCYRVLKPGGEIGFCDVLEDSAMARWLNEFVDHHNPEGHKGNFVGKNQISQLYRQAGFVDIKEQRLDVPWLFDSEEDVVLFCRGLFGLDCSLNQVSQGIDQYLEIESSKLAPYQLNWHLAYASARK